MPVLGKGMKGQTTLRVGTVVLGRLRILLVLSERHSIKLEKKKNPGIILHSRSDPGNKLNADSK
jgi:hypothetical protein